MRRESLRGVVTEEEEGGGGGGGGAQGGGGGRERVEGKGGVADTVQSLSGC